MVKHIAALVLFAASASVIATAQESWETFNSIVLESPTSIPPMKVTLNPPSTGTPYSLTFPGSLPTGDNTRRYSFSRAAGGTDGGLSWYATPYGATNQVAFFQTDEELIGDNSFQWVNANKTLSLTSNTNQPMLNLTKTASISANESLIDINATYSSTTQKVDLTVFDIDATTSALGNGSTVTGFDINVVSGSSSTANPSRATGLKINVTGADTNRAAIIKGGFVGVNTDYPKVFLDVAGDVAYREFNYTGNLGVSNDNVEFDNNGNKHSFIRIGSALGQQVSIKGLKGGYDGKILKLYNATGQTIKVEHDASNTPQNGIKTSANSDLLLLPGNTYELVYSGTDQRWIVTFSGPGELAQLGNKDVGPISDEDILPSSIASYLVVSTGNSQQNYDVYLEDGTSPGQILVVQNDGPEKLILNGSNITLSSANSDLADGEAIIFVWSGSKWVQVARAQN